MGKNTNPIPSLLLPNKHKQIWLWPSCHTNPPKTPSFPDHHKDPFVEPELELTPLGSCFTNSSESASVSTDNDCSSVETIVRGARSQRLFFELDSSSSILDSYGSGLKCSMEKSGEDDDDEGGLGYKESVVVAMESENPYGDFKKSMEEMVEIYELRDWECLEELLGWYLRMNGKDNHDVILGAFVDLLCGGSGGGSSCLHRSTPSFTSAASNFSSPSSSPFMSCSEKQHRK